MKLSKTPKPAPKKTRVPPPGRKMALQQAIERVNKQFAGTFSKLAK